MTGHPAGLRDLVRREIDQADVSQKDIAATVGCSQKHLSEMLNGHAVMSEAWTNRILALLGRRLVVGSAPDRSDDLTTTSPPDPDRGPNSE